MFSEFIKSIVNIAKTIGVVDIIDIAIVAYLFYMIVLFVRETRAAQLFKGIVVFVVAYMIADMVGFTTVKFLLDVILKYGVVAIVVIFQPELRHALERVGRANIISSSIFGKNNLNEREIAAVQRSIITVADAADILSNKKTGALIVMENTTRLGDIISTGTQLDAVPSTELFGNLFFVNTPLHDGAVVVREGRICAAGCILPLSENYEISKEMGTRHRAALGVSENSDAVVVVVSEETGLISIAQGGNIIRGVDRDYLQSVLTNTLLPAKDESEKQKSSVFSKVKEVFHREKEVK